MTRAGGWSLDMALFAAPIAASAMFAAGMTAFLALIGAYPAHMLPGIFGGWLGGCALVLTPVSLTAGLAWHALAMKLRWRNFPAYSAAGAGMGVLAGVGVFFVMSRALSLNGAMIGLVAGAFYGALLWAFRRPDIEPRPHPATAFE